MKLSRAALAAALALGVSGPALAQPAAAPVRPVRALALSAPERNAVAAVGTLVTSPDRAAQDQAIAAARAAVRSPEGRYALGHYQLQIADRRGDAALRVQAIDMMIDSGQAPPDEMGQLLASQASRTLAAGDLPRTERVLARVIELQPDNPAALADYAELKVRMGEAGNGVLLLVRAVNAAQASGQAPPESWILRGLALAFQARMVPQAGMLARALVANYPSALNWRDALLVYRELAPADPTLGIDVNRLMRASQALSGERDYHEYADAAVQAQQIGEAKAVLDEGVARGMVETARIPRTPRDLAAATAARAVTAERGRLAGLRSAALAPAGTGQQARSAGDLHFGNGLHAEAAELYRAALLKGGEDANLVNSRLGAALALAGRRAEAETALRLVTGPRADLAGFWLAWLSRRPAV